MSLERIHRAYLEDILDAIEKTHQFIQNMTRPQFEQDDKTVYAVTRALEIIGEASKNIPDNIKAQYPHVPWRFMARMRDKLTHAYFGVDLDVVWQTINDDLPPLKTEIEQILAELEKSDDTPE